MDVQCTYTHPFWIDLDHLILSRKLILHLNRIFVFSENVKISLGKMYEINFLILIAKFHIHCFKCCKQITNIIALKATLTSYLLWKGKRPLSHLNLEPFY